MGNSSRARDVVPADEQLARESPTGQLAIEGDAVSSELFGRLDAADRAEIERRICGDPELSAHWTVAATDSVRRFLLLCAGLWLDIPSVSEKTGLTSLQPPEDARDGAGPAGGGRRPVRGRPRRRRARERRRRRRRAPLRARLRLLLGTRRARARSRLSPTSLASAAIPNEPAVAWAQSTFPGSTSSSAPTHPPLRARRRRRSTWSTRSRSGRTSSRPGTALVRRRCTGCIRPGRAPRVHNARPDVGRASTPPTGCARRSNRARSLGALYRDRWWYAPEFGEGGDWGVVNPDWGTAFLSPEWLLDATLPALARS